MKKVKRSKRKYRRKLWLDHRSRKLTNKNKKRRKKRSRKKHYTLLTLPEYFSLTGNTEITMNFIINLYKKIDKAGRGSHIFIDSHNVKIVTVEALIYLIASIQNNHTCSAKKIICTGNYPKDKEAKKIYLNSGFNDYVRSRIKSLPHSNEKMEIKSGSNTVPEIAQQCCIFTHNKQAQTKNLYTTIIELMSNTFHHAYNGNYWTEKKLWYIYAEREDDRIRFIFVDTGDGIAKTVRKNFAEKIKLLFGDITGLTINDAQLIQSAFNGDFRTATKQENRGNGLVTIKECMSNPPFENFEVISGHGRYSIAGKATNYSNKIYGTLFTFELRQGF